MGDMNFELLQPTEGPNLWSEFMAARGEGIASIAVMFKEREEGDAAKAAFRSRFGIDVTMRALIGDHIEYYYLDTEARFACLIESGSGHAIDFVSPVEVFPGPGTPPSTKPAGLDYPITQVTLVVRNLDPVLAAYREAFGWGPWAVYEDGALEGCTFHGGPAAFRLRLAQAQVGSLNVELVQPLGGSSPWQDHLDRKGEGLVSIGLALGTSGDVDTALVHLERAGVGILASGRLGDAPEWRWLDTEGDLKCLVALGTRHALDARKPTRTVG